MTARDDTKAVPRPVARLLVLDVVAVLSFVVIGRDTHDGGTAVSDVLATSAPFLLGLLPGWVVGRIAGPLISVRAGIVTACATAVVGLALRRLVFGDGIATPFIIVAVTFLMVAFIGWRLVYSVLATRRRSSGRS